MIASLMMYARPELGKAHARFWQLIRDELALIGIDSPATLDQSAYGLETWKRSDLVLSQTCGMPYRLWLKDEVTLVGTPDYGLETCPAGYYRSPIVVRVDDSRRDLTDYKEATFAYNQTSSQSGYAAPYNHIKALGFWFGNRVQTDAHLNSAKFVAEERADIAALDAVTWRLIQRYEPIAQKLRVIEWTTPTPGLPLITAKQNDGEAMFAAISRAIDQLRPDDSDALGIQGIVRIPKAEYLSVPNPPSREQ